MQADAERYNIQQSHNKKTETHRKRHEDGQKHKILTKNKQTDRQTQRQAQNKHVSHQQNHTQKKQTNIETQKEVLDLATIETLISKLRRNEAKLDAESLFFLE